MVKGITAQLKIQQMMFMILAVTLLFILAGLFFFSVYLSNVKGKASELHKEQAMLVVSRIANSPEFQCDSEESHTGSCIDFDKAFKLSLLKEYNAEKFWKISKIEIRKLYPEIDREVLCSPATYPDCNRLIVYGEKERPSQGAFVSLCRKQAKGDGHYIKCELGKILVAMK